MKLILTVCVFSVIYFHQLCHHSTKGQFMEDVSLTFKNFTFDMSHRGTFNVSYCIREMLNCWELLKADLICKSERQVGSVCDLMHEQCNDEYRDYDGYDYIFAVYESVCSGDKLFSKLRSSNLSDMPNLMSMANPMPMGDMMSMANAMPMANPMAIANGMPMGNPIPMANAMPMANPMPMANVMPNANPMPIHFV